MLTDALYTASLSRGAGVTALLASDCCAAHDEIFPVQQNLPATFISMLSNCSAACAHKVAEKTALFEATIVANLLDELLSELFAASSDSKKSPSRGCPAPSPSNSTDPECKTDISGKKVSTVIKDSTAGTLLDQTKEELVPDRHAACRSEMTSSEIVKSLLLQQTRLSGASTESSSETFDFEATLHLLRQSLPMDAECTELNDEFGEHISSIKNVIEATLQRVSKKLGNGPSRLVSPETAQNDEWTTVMNLLVRNSESGADDIGNGTNESGDSITNILRRYESALHKLKAQLSTALDRRAPSSSEALSESGMLSPHRNATQVDAISLLKEIEKLATSISANSKDIPAAQVAMNAAAVAYVAALLTCRGTKAPPPTARRPLKTGKDGGKRTGTKRRDLGDSGSESDLIDFGVSLLFGFDRSKR